MLHIVLGNMLFAGVGMCTSKRDAYSTPVVKVVIILEALSRMS